MKHINLKSFALGVGMTVLVTGLSVTALAATGAVTFNTSALQFNGVQVSAKGEDYTLANGCSAPSVITYTDEKGGGTNYLPARRISELMGVEIGYDGATGSVTVKGDAKTPAQPTTPPDTTASTDYSDWSKEDEAAYQEFKSMWKVAFSRLDETYNINHYEATYTGNNEYINTLRTFTKKKVEMLTMRLTEEFFDPSHQLMVLFVDNNGAVGTCKIRIDDDGRLIKSSSPLYGIDE